MYPDWVPEYIREMHRKNGSAFRDGPKEFRDMFIERFATAESLDKFWNKYRKYFETDEECYRWVFKACFYSYVDFDLAPEHKLTLREREKKFEDFSKALVRVDSLAKDFGLSGKLWNLLPFECLEKACFRAASLCENEQVRNNPDRFAFALDLDHYLSPMPNLTEFLSKLKESAYSATYHSDYLGSPNARYGRVNFFIRAFYCEAKKICTQPNYDRIADLVNVLFPETEIGSIHVRDRIKDYK